MIKKIAILFSLLSFFFITSLYANTQYDSVSMGKVSLSTKKLCYGDRHISLYNVRDQDYILLTSLKEMGVKTHFEQDIVYIDNQVLPFINESSYVNEKNTELLNQTAFMCRLPVYCGGIRSYTVCVQEQKLIPIKALGALWKLKLFKDNYTLEPYYKNQLPFIEVVDTKLCNTTDHIVPVSYVTVYWNNMEYEYESYKVVMEPYEKKPLEIDKDKLYITTYFTTINGLAIEDLDPTLYGQYHKTTFLKYEDGVRLKKLNYYFPESIMLATMKYPINSLNIKEQVEIIRGEKRTYFWVKSREGKLIQVPFGSVNIIGEKGVAIPSVTTSQIEDFINLNEIKSKTDYIIWTDLCRQRTYVFKRDAHLKWHLCQNFICSSGKKTHPTPRGLYEIEYTIPYIGIEKGYRCKNALVFFRDYMYHSILFDKSGKYMKSGQYELGSKASHGCIRLSEKDSRWLYENIPHGTTVWIR